jgi:hypothetical protein
MLSKHFSRIPRSPTAGAPKVNDFESSSLHLDVHENEYLCVELSIFLPSCSSPSSSSPASPDFTSVTQPVSLSPSPPASHHWSSLDRNNVPFPTPPNTEKIVLFQGAVPYAALQDVFTQKGLQAQNALKLSWSRLNGESNRPRTFMSGQPGQPTTGSSSSSTSTTKDRTEFIMMRGPKGKGQCQVAISNLRSLSEGESPVLDGENSSDDRSSRLKTLFGDRFKMVAGAMKSLIGGEKGTRAEDVGSVEGLMGSITYVNVAWQSIVNDLLDYARKQGPPRTTS